jgi:hypothetical protein
MGRCWQSGARADGGVLFARGAGFLGEAFPVVGEELVDAAVRVGRNPGEQVAQVGEGVEPVAACARNQAEVDGGSASAAVGAEEKPVFAVMPSFA